MFREAAHKLHRSSKEAAHGAGSFLQGAYSHENLQETVSFVTGMPEKIKQARP